MVRLASAVLLAAVLLAPSDVSAQICMPEAPFSCVFITAFETLPTEPVTVEGAGYARGIPEGWGWILYMTLYPGNLSGTWTFSMYAEGNVWQRTGETFDPFLFEAEGMPLPVASGGAEHFYALELQGTNGEWMYCELTACTVAPEPSTWLLLATGLVGMAGVGIRHRSAA